MTACVCGHRPADHEPLNPQCSAPRCDCLRFRPSPATAAAVPVKAGPPQQPQAVTVAQLAAACRRSEYKRTQALGGRLTELADRIRDALRTEREAAEAKAVKAEAFAKAKADVDRLARELKAARAALKGLKPSGVTEAALSFACDECGESFGTAQGRGAHRAHKHGFRRTGAA